MTFSGRWLPDAVTVDTKMRSKGLGFDWHQSKHRVEPMAMFDVDVLTLRDHGIQVPRD